MGVPVSSEHLRKVRRLMVEEAVKRSVCPECESPLVAETNWYCKSSCGFSFTRKREV